MWYAITGQDVPDSLSRRLASRPAHVARLQLLQAQGRLLLAGPFPAVDAEDPGAAGYTGSLIVAEFPSLSAAQDWANTDPYLSSGVYDQVSVQPFKKAFPA
ncbi:MAG: YciI family protein [Gallionella sp.]|nr:YciI family protein [Gallionella sp.]